jgi:23S rRNA pseudouridine1911/1915/1917 synthase
MPIVVTRSEVAADRAGRIDRVVQELTGRSRADVRGLFDHDCVRLNGEVCIESGMRVKVGDVVVVRHDPRTRYREKPRERENAAFRLVFEDEQLLVVDKAAAVLTVPTDHGEANTLLDAVGRYLNRRGHRGQAAVVHRLDRGTSGLLVFGKNPRIGRELQAQFRVRKAEREYAALVAGSLERNEGTFASRLGTTKSLRRYSVRPDQNRQGKGRQGRGRQGRGRQGEEGESAVTHFRVERKLREATYVRVRLETGRRNQIRVHFAEAGHPVLGDERYHAGLARHPAWTANRLALHAAVLGFEHPRSHERLRFESPLPPEFERFIAQMRWHSPKGG